MSVRTIALCVVIAAFGVLSALALMSVGYFGILAPHFRSWGEAQVLADLVILAALACVWMRKDAREHGLTAWPFIVATVFVGSFGPLFYLVAREWKMRRPQAAASSSTRFMANEGV
jgi:hypothetical protein